MAFLVIHGFRTQLFCILRKNLTEGRYAEFRRRSESILYRFFLPRYILLGLRLDCGILSQDKEEVLTRTDEIFRSQVSLRQKKESCLKAFGFFLQAEDRKQSRFFLDQVREYGDDSLHRNMENLYRKTFPEA